MTKKLRVAVVGCGRISPMHIISIKNLNSIAELVAVCDIREDRAVSSAKEYGCNAFTDYNTLFDAVNPDAVHLCVPHYMHPVIAKSALKRGINVLSEKPMAINMGDAIECVDIAEKNNIQYGVIFQCRYNDSSVCVKRALDEGKLGKIISARSTLTWARPEEYYADSDWKGTWDKEGGGVIIDQAIHSIDLVNWFVDSEPESVSCSIANRGHSRILVEDSAEGLVKYKNGVKYGFYCMNNYDCDEPIEIRLFCEKGKVSLTYDDAYIEYNDGTREEVHQRDIGIDYGNKGKDYWGFRHFNQICQFYNALLGREPLQISGKEALKTQKLICAMYDSGKIGKEIKL